MTRATAQDVLRILQEKNDEVEERLGIRPLQMSFPVDGQGVRIQVSVRPGEGGALPDALDCTLDGRALRIPLEVTEEDDEFVAF